MTMRPLILSLLAAAALTPALPACSQPAPAPAAEATAKPMDAAERRAVIEDLAAKLEARFVFPEVGKKYATMLRAKLAAGAYDQVTDPAAFGKAVSADLQAVASDGHLKLRPLEEWSAPRPTQGGQPARRFGLTELKMIGQVAYMSYSGFNGDAADVAKARSFLLEHAGEIRAVVIDSRDNHGGGLDEMDALLPLFFGRKTTLVRMDTRAESAEDAPDFPGLVRQPSPKEFVRNDHVVTPDSAETRLRAVPFYYLTSHVTASAAEHLALAFKHTHRAVLVGETTRGAGHYGGVEKIGGRFGAFIPIGRTYDPDTGWDWEGKGVAPDIAVPADQALAEALKQARAKGVDTGSGS
jgi:hypothetical protein